REYDKSTSAGLIEPPFTLEDYRAYVTTRITPEVLDFLGAESRIGTERVRAVSGLLQTDVEDRLILKSDYLFEREEF
ncbi:MAG: hypothetical protein KDD70_19290, partial [Bdellovibrionales bacterium]|nr:hypothetical protein [Bdellovibrionales bacterium]